MNAAYPVTVGTFTTTEPTEVTELYECAAWHKTIVAPAGTYEVRAYVGHGRVSDVYIHFTGTISSSHFGAGDNPHKVGNSDEVARSVYTFKAVADNRFTWNDRITWNGTEAIVSRDRREDIALSVATVSTHKVNAGNPSEFWRITARVHSNRWGFRNLELNHRVDGEGAEDRARALVAKIETSGTICPAHWRS